MIREDRDPAFWSATYEHPDVKPHVGLGQSLDVAAIVADPRVTPLAAEHGGFLFVQLDELGRVFELHTMFTPEGWGREVLLAAKAAFSEMFVRGADVIVTHEVKGNPRSQPPISFRFRAAGDFAPALGAALRTWTLTRTAWAQSPALARM
ncbi:MAG TPA: hypothetical protein VJ775_05935 [Sphingomicrobium sp.]|nr:hypothetical protein [Sphingomicrobium sp.]